LGFSGLFGPDPFQQVIFILFCFSPIAFFLNFRLYSHHLIYSLSYHLTRLGAACGLGLLTIGITGITCRWSELIPSWLFVPAVIVIATVIVGLDRFLDNRVIEDNLLALLKALGLAFLAVGLIAIYGPVEESLVMVHLGKIIIGVLSAAAALFLTRLLIVHLVFNQLLRRHFRRQVLLIGLNEDAEKITNRIIRRHAPFWIAGTISPQPGDQLSSQVPKGHLGKVQDLDAVLGEHFFQDVIITDETIPKAELIRLLDLFTGRGIDAWFTPKLMPIIGVKLNIDDLCGIPMIRLNSVRHLWLLRKIKHAFDAVAVLAGFVFLWPVFAGFALAIKMGSPGPVFYRAQAVGKGARFFTLFKFRSMITGVSTEVHKDYVTRMIKGEITQDGSGKTLKITNDPRVTKIGRILRKTSMDELPQLINVLRGEMSLVGPRPCLPYEFEVYRDWHKKRTAVRPGITGLWQVVGRSEVSFEDMILLDLYYIYNYSLELDFSILFETIFVVIRKKGAH
jgi:undecaprenyl-phosphate galactose phosphotransferase